MLSPQSDSNNDCNANKFSHNQPSPVSNLTTKTQVDTDVKYDDDTQSFVIPQKHNHGTPEIPDNPTIKTLVKPFIHSYFHQIHSPASTTLSKLHGKNSSATQCAKEWVFNKVIDSIL